jgi:hypothetical protein
LIVGCKAFAKPMALSLTQLLPQLTVAGIRCIESLGRQSIDCLNSVDESLAKDGGQTESENLPP